MNDIEGLTGIIYVGKNPRIPSPNDAYAGWENYGIATEGDDVAKTVIECFKKHIENEKGTNGRTHVRKKIQGNAIHFEVKRNDHEDLVEEFYIATEQGVQIVAARFVLEGYGFSPGQDNGYVEFTKAHPKLDIVTIGANPETKYAQKVLETFLQQLPAEKKKIA